MIRRSLAFLMLGLFSATAVLAQTPEPAPRAFSMFFDGSGGYLGVQTVDVTSENFSKYGLREVRGVAVDKVVDGSPAQAAGLRDGDVILRLNNEPVTSVRKLTRLISEIAPDHQVSVTVLRGGSERELTATLGKRPGPTFAGGSFSMAVPPRAEGIPMPPIDIPDLRSIPKAPGAPLEGFVWRSGTGRRIGIGVTPLTKQLSDHFGVTNGVLVNEVREGSAAERAGLRAGDIIVEADGKALHGDMDLVRAIAEKKEGDISLTIVRDRSRQTINVTPEEVKSGVETLFEGDGGNFKLSTPVGPSAAPVILNELMRFRRIL